jgi:hypothetical protein
MSDEWDAMKEGGLWEAVTTPAISQRLGIWDKEAPPHEEFAHYGASYDAPDYGDPLHYGQGATMRLPSSTYPNDTIFNNGRDYLQPPPPPPPSRSSNTSTSPLGFQAELQQLVPNTLAAPSTADNTI